MVVFRSGCRTVINPGDYYEKTLWLEELPRNWVEIAVSEPENLFGCFRHRFLDKWPSSSKWAEPIIKAVNSWVEIIQFNRAAWAMTSIASSWAAHIIRPVTPEFSQAR